MPLNALKPSVLLLIALLSACGPATPPPVTVPESWASCDVTKPPTSECETGFLCARRDQRAPTEAGVCIPPRGACDSAHCPSGWLCQLHDSNVPAAIECARP